MNRLNMTLRQLEVLYAILRMGSVTGAANSLHVTQPAISNILTHTEQQIGMQLFQRKKGRLVPTPEVLKLLPEMDKIFGRVESVSRLIDELRDGRGGHVALATSPTLVNSLLPEPIAAFRQQNPHTRVKIQSLPTQLAVLCVARREVDFGIVYGPVDDPLVEAQPLLKAHIVCAIQQSHHLATKPVIHTTDLLHESVISTGSRTRLGILIEQGCAALGQEPPAVTIEASSSLSACHMASCGAGAALVDSTATLGFLPGNLLLKPFHPEITLRIDLIYPLDQPPSRPTQALSAILKAAFASQV